MNLRAVPRPQRYSNTIRVVFFLLLALTSCSRHGAPQTTGVDNGIDSFQLQKGIQSDELWTDRLLFDALEGLKSGKAQDVIKQLHSISNAIYVLQLTDDGIDCAEPILLSRERTMQKLIKFSDQCGVDVNVIRFLSIEEKMGFAQALITIVDNYNKKAGPGTANRQPNSRKPRRL